jgi:hypothetical protein
LRRFRAYLKKHGDTMTYPRDTEFWMWFLSKEAEPGSNGMFKSYSKHHRNYLRSHESFVNRFNEWYIREGRGEAVERLVSDTVYADAVCAYAEREIMGATGSRPNSFQNLSNRPPSNDETFLEFALAF